MNRRLTVAELSDGVAKRATVPVSFAEKFVQSFFDVVEEALVKEKLVKVKGLGTFKLVDVEARESVDVNTGERILLAAHSKVTFTPDAALRDTINRPFADFETVLLNDETPTEQMEALDGETAEREVPIAAAALAEASMILAEEETVVEENLPNVVEAEVNVLEDELEETRIEEPRVEETPTEVKEPEDKEPEVQEPKVPEPESKELNVPEPESKEPEVQEPEVQEPKVESEAPAEETVAVTTAESQAVENKILETVEPLNANNSNMLRRTFLNILAALVCMFLGYATCYYFRPFELPTLSPASQEQKATTIEKSSEHDTAAPSGTPESKPASPSEASESKPASSDATASKPAKSYPQLEGGDYEIVGVQATEVMSPGKTLLNISLKYFKSTDFVPYICTMNGIDNPDVVPLNKELQIPELKKK